MRASYYLLTVLLLLCALAAFMASGNIATAIDKPPIAPSAAEDKTTAGKKHLTIKQFKEKYPEYADRDDTELANKLYDKYYSHLDKEEFMAAVMPAASNTSALSTMPAYLSWFIKSYDDCILDYMQNSSNPTATGAISMACRRKYKEQHGSAFDDCILDNIKAVNDDTAVGIIVRSCRNKFGQPYP